MSQGPTCGANVPTEGRAANLASRNVSRKEDRGQIRSGTIEGAGGDIVVVVVGL